MKFLLTFNEYISREEVCSNFSLTEMFQAQVRPIDTKEWNRAYKPPPLQGPSIGGAVAYQEPVDFDKISSSLKKRKMSDDTDFFKKTKRISSEQQVSGDEIVPDVDLGRIEDFVKDDEENVQRWRDALNSMPPGI